MEETLPAGPVTRGALFDLIDPADARVVSWPLSGAQVDSILEGLVSESLGDPRETPQLSGFTAAIDLSGPQGDRVSLALDPGRTYRLATLNWRAGWLRELLKLEGEGWPGLVSLELTPIQAVEEYLGKHRPYTPVQELRLSTLGR